MNNEIDASRRISLADDDIAVILFQPLNLVFHARKKGGRRLGQKSNAGQIPRNLA